LPAETRRLYSFKAIVRLAGNADVTPYAADKVFWLIGSGYFYDDLQVGKNGRIGSRKGDFYRTHTNGVLRQWHRVSRLGVGNHFLASRTL